MNESKANYEHVSHYHCWNQDGDPACGIALEKHEQCCLCDLKPTHESNFRDVNCPKCGFRNTEGHLCDFPTHEIEGWDKERARLVKLIFSEISAIASENDARQYIISEEEIHKLIDQIETNALKDQQERIVKELEERIIGTNGELIVGYDAGIVDAIEMVRRSKT